MKVLLSAYACEPGKGSEPGVGWRWAIEIARRGHEVTVLTRANNRETIEAGIEADPDFPAYIDFAYCDLPAFARALKHRFKAILLYYACWQWGAYRLARKLHAERNFDLVHHITFVSIRHFSFMGRLGIPFVLGPLAGGETSPFWLRWHTGAKGGLRDTWRDIVSFLSRFDPVAKGALGEASAIAVTTGETLRLIPRQYRSKARCVLQIGVDGAAETTGTACTEERCKRLLYAGNFIYLKGMAIGLHAFARACAADPALFLTLVGKGPEEKRWRRLAERLGVARRITWISWLPQAELYKLYAEHGVFLFPSLHDSGGQAVLEALSFGLPVVCLKLGGPGVIVDEKCGRAIETDHGDFERLIDDMARVILDFTATPETWEAASARARAATAKWSWSARVEELEVY